LATLIPRVVRRLKRELRGAPRAAGPSRPAASWSLGLSSELEYWRYWIDTRGGEWPRDFEARLDPLWPFLEDLRERLGTDPPTRVRLLDVGAGPLTVLGSYWPGHVVEIVAVDPLAEEYGRLLDRAGITPRVRTEPGCAEDLVARFGSGVFDIVFCRNALDHSSDPLEGIRQMFEAVAPGGYVYLAHSENEAERRGYEGLHQWNLCSENGRLVLWRPAVRRDVAAELGPRAVVTCETPPDYVVATIRKSKELA